MTTTWCPPLPTIGRAGPRIVVLRSSTILKRLEEYYANNRSVADVFERRISPAWQERTLRRRGAPAYLSEFSPNDQQTILLRNLYFRVSSSLRAKMRRRLDSGALNQVRAWFQTADAAVLPLLISEEYHTDLLEVECDVLTNWSLENCAHNYAKFQSDWKGLKKRMRKSFALHNDLDHVECPGHMVPYWRAAKSALKRFNVSGPADIGRFVLLWCQTRATGMADHSMILKSFEKFEATVTDPGVPYRMDPAVLRKVCIPAMAVDGLQAKVSVGPTACLESTRSSGGKTAYLSRLARCRSVRAEYNFRTLEETPTEPRPVRSAKDLVNWAIYTILHNPTYTCLVRIHGVAEPSKARTISVAPYAYQVLMGVFAHIFQPSLRAKQVKSGLKADRHLWRFLTDVLNPQNKEWGELIDGNVYALSTDLSEATDWGNRDIARQIWQALIEHAENPDFPLGLSLLAKSKYCGKRFALLPVHTNKYKLVIMQRGWMMGDMMTKVILTLSHQYCCELSRLSVYTLVGDDEIALDSNRRRLERHLDNLGLIFKVSELDTFISTNLAFYCEEGSLVPQSVLDVPHVRMRRAQELDYLDYPRIRLLLPQPSEVDAYSMSNIGRFALLGKETRWVCSTNKPASRMFHTAGLLQHILVPQEPDCISPYTPLEIGGDGAFPMNGRHMRSVVENNSRNSRETKFRLHSLLNNRFGYKFVRSNRTDKVVHKHHLYLPKIEGMRQLLPPEAVVVPRDQQCKLMMQSLKIPIFSDPQSVFFKIAKGLYYQALLEGKNPPEPKFSIEREFSKANHTEPEIDYDLFIDTWSNPGFKFQDSWGYFVDETKIPKLNPMNLGWDWTEHRRSVQSSKQIFIDWAQENLDLLENNLEELIATIRDQKPLPQRVVARLNLFMESDSYVLSVLPREHADNETLALITRDQKLSLLLKRKLDAWNPRIQHKVICVDPALYMIGRAYELLDEATPSIEDPGAMLHVDYTEFTDGFPHDEEIWDKEIFIKRTARGAYLLTYK
jgi:hypothetical protein